MRRDTSAKQVTDSSAIEVTIDGVTYHSMYQAAKELGIAYQTIRKHVRDRGFVYEEGMTDTRKPVTIDGVTYASGAEASRVLGLSLFLITYRRKRYGDSFARIIPRKGKSVTIDGVTYRTQSEAAQVLGVTRQAIASRASVRAQYAKDQS